MKGTTATLTVNERLDRLENSLVGMSAALEQVQAEVRRLRTTIRFVAGQLVAALEPSDALDI